MSPSSVGQDRIAVGPIVAGHEATALLAEFGSPLYVYDGGVVRRRVDRLRAALPDRVDLAYATKANSSPAVLRLMASTGVGADVASGGELVAVAKAGFDPFGVVFTGPGKTDDELRAGLRMGVGALTVESLDELDAIMGMAAEARPGQGLMLRLATGGEAEERPIIGGDASVKFGLTDDEADEALGRLAAAGLAAGSAVAGSAAGGPFAVRGFHAFGASNVLDAGRLADAVVDLARRAEWLATNHGLAISVLDAGGGFGIPYDDDERELDVEALGTAVKAEMDGWADRPALREARLLFEPGRWFTGPAGAYLCRVVRTKIRDGRSIAVTDGGIHHLLRPRLVGQDHRVRPLHADAQRASDAHVDIVGPLCTGIDYLASIEAAPQPRQGDLYAVLDAGAYGYSESMPFFLSHPIPAEILVEGDEVTVSRPRIEPG